MNDREVMFDSSAVRAAISRVADGIIEEFVVRRKENFALVGLYRKGVPLAERLAKIITERSGFIPELGKLDISMYRDDIGTRKSLPKINATIIPFDVEENNIVLVDDVLSTGRTIRAALDAMTDYGRPSRIRLAVLIDRLDSEFPIHADYKGMDIEVDENIKLVAEFAPEDDVDAIYKVQW